MIDDNTWIKIILCNRGKYILLYNLYERKSILREDMSREKVTFAERLIRDGLLLLIQKKDLSEEQQKSDIRVLKRAGLTYSYYYDDDNDNEYSYSLSEKGHDIMKQVVSQRNEMKHWPRKQYVDYLDRAKMSYTQKTYL